MSQLQIEFAVPLTKAVRNTGIRHSWNVVSLADDFAKNGYCSSSNNSFIVSRRASYAIQGDDNGSLHPDSRGHALIADRVLTAVKAKLYPHGKARLPRP